MASLLETVLRRIGAERLAAALTPEQRLVLSFTWAAWARPTQLAPPGEWLTWLILSGRGWGKTRCGAEWLIEKARARPGCRVALIGRTVADVRDTMVEGESGLLACSAPWFRPEYQPAVRRVLWPNGSQGTTFTADALDALRGPQHHYAWADEIASWADAEQVWNNMLLGLRLGERPQVCATSTPKPLGFLRKLVANPTTRVTRGSTYDNASNLAPAALAEFRALYGDVGRLAKQELYGELLPDNDQAMFDPSWFALVSEAPADAKKLRYWDLASTPDEPGKDPDWTVGAKLGLKEGVWYVLDVVRLRGTPMAVERAVHATAEADGERVPVVMEQEPGSSGVSMIDHYRRHVLVGHNFKADRKTGSKIELAGPLSAAAQAGNVKLLRAPWNAAFLDEAAEFPMGGHDDQVDACSGAMRFLRGPVASLADLSKNFVAPLRRY